MTMWSSEWMVLYALAILIGNIAVILIAGHVNRRSSKRSQANNSENQQELTNEAGHRIN